MRHAQNHGGMDEMGETVTAHCRAGVIADHESIVSHSDLRLSLRIYGGMDEWFKSTVY